MRILLAAIAVALATPIAAQAVQTPAATVAETAATRFVAAFNAPGSLETFVAANFTQAALGRESAKSRATDLDRLKAEAGGLSVIESKQQGERMVEMTAATRNGAKFARLVLFTSGKEPGKITDIFVLDARDPKRVSADAFPKAKVSDQEAARLIKRRVDALTKEDRFSGAVIVAHRDKVIFREARGLADQDWKIPNKTSTRFHIASVGKMWTAVAVMRLVEQGKLSLDDTLAKWVPSYPHKEAAEKITLRMLLQHRAGLAEWDGRKLGNLDGAQTAATMTEAPGEPDKRFSYSNAGYVLLQAAAEAATGISFEQLMRQHVFAPAGMTRSGVWPVTAIVTDRATGYLRPASDPLGFGPRYANAQFLGYGANGSGGGYSTVDDMLAFNRALASGKLVKPETLARMKSESVEFPGTQRPSRYGLGLTLTDCAGVPTLGHGGGGPNSGVSSVTYASLDGEWTVVVLSNYDPPAAEDLAFDICELVHRK